MSYSENQYKNMWEDFAKAKSVSYLDYKFDFTHRVGLTNYLREKLILKMLSPDKNDIVLDAGCASGRQLFQISDKIKVGHGIDISDKFIEEANNYKQKKKVDNLFFSQLNLDKLSFKNNFFDKIICAEVLEHVLDKDRVLSELLRVLKDNGTLIITVPNLNADATLWGRLLRIMGIRKFKSLKDFSYESLVKHRDAHIREFSKKKLANWLSLKKIKIIDYKSVSFIDGPYVDFILKIFLHFFVFRYIIITIENLLTRSNLFFGRHLVVKIVKK